MYQMTKEPIKTSHNPPPFSKQKFRPRTPSPLSQLHVLIRCKRSLQSFSSKCWLKDLHEMFCTWLLYCQRQFVLIELGYVNGVVKHNVYLT